jgi:hypothetical protein
MEILVLIIILAIGLVSFYIKEKEKNFEKVKDLNESKLTSFRLFNDVFLINTKVLSMCQSIEDYYPGSKLEKESEMPFRVKKEEAFKIESTGYILDKIHLRTTWIIMTGKTDRIILILILKNNIGTTSIREVGQVFEKKFEFNEESEDAKILDIIKKFVKEKSLLK